MTLKDDITRMISLLQGLIDIEIPAATMSFVVANAQSAFEAQNIPAIVEDLYFMMTKQKQYSEITPVMEFLGELPARM